jgi:hypothetical protein
VSPTPGRSGLDASTSAVPHAAGSLAYGATSATANETRLRLEVRTPSDVRVGEVFEVRVDLEANAPLRELMFLLGYEKTRLTLVGWSKGDFPHQHDLPFDLGAEEPSDGNIQVGLNVRKGSSAAGAGNIVVLQFEAIRAGTSGITLQNVAATNASGNMDPNAFILRDGQVTIR